MDKGYGSPRVESEVKDHVYLAHIRRIGAEKLADGKKTHPARRWVVERTFAWLGRCRRLAKDWERTIESATAWACVASIRLVAGREQEVHVDFDPTALAARGLTVGQLARAVQGELRDISGGDIPLGKRRYIVRTELTPDDPVINDHLGDAYWRVGREREARFQWERALTFEPTEADVAQIEQKLRSGLPPADIAGDADRG